MTLGHDESLEDYEERFQLSYKMASFTLNPRPLKLVIIIGIMEDLIETLSMISGGDIYELFYCDIKTIFGNHSRVARNKGRAS